MIHFVLEVSLIDFIFHAVFSLMNNHEPSLWTTPTFIDKIVSLIVLTLLCREFTELFTFYRSWSSIIKYRNDKAIKISSFLLQTNRSVFHNVILQGLRKRSLGHASVRLLNLTFLIQVALYQVCIVTGQNIRSPITFGLALLTFAETVHVVYCAIWLKAFESKLTTAARLSF